MPRARYRDLGLAIGRIPTGRYNAITDVDGVLVGHTTLVHDSPRIARTGVTVVVPRESDIWNDNAFCGCFSFNGNGEMTGIPWIEESGMLGSIIGITNTHQVGLVRDALVEYAIDNGYAKSWLLPVVAETYDGFLNDIDAFHVTKEHVFQAIASASGGTPAEGCVGGGTGMICHDFKGGIGTSSRLVETRSGRFTVGALVQANYGYGARADLRVDGVPVALLLQDLPLHLLPGGALAVVERERLRVPHDAGDILVLREDETVLVRRVAAPGNAQHGRVLVQDAVRIEPVLLGARREEVDVLDAERALPLRLHHRHVMLRH